MDAALPMASHGLPSSQEMNEELEKLVDMSEPSKERFLVMNRIKPYIPSEAVK